MDLLDRLLGHDHWATARLLDLSRGLTDAQLDQPFDVGHRTLRETFDHMIFVVDFWIGLMAEQPVTPECEGHRSIAALIDRRVRDEQRLDDPFVDHFAIRKTLGGTILHVVLHNAQHRSEALHILERLGVPDLWDGDPQEWEHETQGISPVSPCVLNPPSSSPHARARVRVPTR